MYGAGLCKQPESDSEVHAVVAVVNAKDCRQYTIVPSRRIGLPVTDVLYDCTRRIGTRSYPILSWCPRVVLQLTDTLTGKQRDHPLGPKHSCKPYLSGFRGLQALCASACQCARHCNSRIAWGAYEHFTSGQLHGLAVQ